MVHDTGQGTVKRYKADDEQTWFVVFNDSSDLWWSGIFKAGFKHVWCYKQMDDLRIVVVNYMGYRLDVREFEANPYAVAVDLMTNGCRVVQLTHAPEFRMLYRGAMSCVNVVESTIGCGRLAITPYRLYSRLLEIGGIEL